MIGDQVEWNGLTWTVAALEGNRIRKVGVGFPEGRPGPGLFLLISCRIPRSESALRRLGTTTNHHSPFFSSLLDHACPSLPDRYSFLGLCLAVRRSSPSPSRPRPEAVQQSLDKLAERKLAEADQKVAKASLNRPSSSSPRDEALQSLEDLKSA